MQIRIDSSVSQFSEEINDLCGIDVNKCYQCGKCSAGCTVAQFIDESPTKLIRYIQLGQSDLVYNSKTPYICASCNTCSSRCPMDIDISKLMESVRISAKKNGKHPPVEEVDRFSRIYLDSVKNNGRLFELGLMIKYNLENKTPFKDAELGPVAIMNGKLGFIPQKIKNKDRMKNIFNKSKYFEEREVKKKNH
jgi:heterodisulfide reductase subunit C